MDERILDIFVYMVRTTVKPQKQDICIHVPADYVGRELEVVLYPVDEITEEKPLKKSLAALRGALHLNEEEKIDLQNHLDQIRDEWSNNI